MLSILGNNKRLIRRKS